jgi:hypothetical protein
VPVNNPSLKAFVYTKIAELFAQKPISYHLRLMSALEVQLHSDIPCHLPEFLAHEKQTHLQ